MFVFLKLKINLELSSFVTYSSNAEQQKKTKLLNVDQSKNHRRTNELKLGTNKLYL